MSEPAHACAWIDAYTYTYVHVSGISECNIRLRVRVRGYTKGKTGLVSRLSQMDPAADGAGAPVVPAARERVRERFVRQTIQTILHNSALQVVASVRAVFDDQLVSLCKDLAENNYDVSDVLQRLGVNLMKAWKTAIASDEVPDDYTDAASRLRFTAQHIRPTIFPDESAESMQSIRQDLVTRFLAARGDAKSNMANFDVRLRQLESLGGSDPNRELRKATFAHVFTAIIWQFHLMWSFPGFEKLVSLCCRYVYMTCVLFV
jgi:hypothetical protein